MGIVPIRAIPPHSFSPALVILCCVVIIGRIVVCGQKDCDGAFQVRGVETTDCMMITKLPYLEYVVLRKNHFEYVILTGGGVRS